MATALVQVALDDRDPGAGLPLLCVSLALAVVLRLMVRRNSVESWTPGVVACVLAVSLLPLPWDGASRLLFRVGAPYEVQLAYILRNSMLALAATLRLPRAMSYAVLGSFFLTVFGYLWSHGPWAVALLVVYALLGTWWLLAAYWERLGGRFADSSESAIPIRPAVAAIAAIALAGALFLPLAGRSVATTALNGFFPSSGGTQWNDPFAHGGVGDGDQMVAAKENASSFGPVESELFLESKMPSLYDAFNELSEAAPIKQKRLRRSIPLAPSSVQMNHQKRGTTQQATREFSTVRRAKRRDTTPDDLSSAALLLVKGRTPLHLGLEAYDHWDGRRLTASAAVEAPALRLRSAPDRRNRRWLDLAVLHPTDVYSATAFSQVRVVNLKTERVPTPSGTTRVTMQGLHAASMFKFAEDGSLAMDVQRVPQLTIFDFDSRLRDRGAELQVHRSPVAPPDSKICALAVEWTQHAAPGWPQIETVVERLRAEYAHDPEAMVPEDVDDAAEHFLFEAKRGPDYLFATSAAVLLRSLGYDTRVRSGFYANPERYNRRARLTTVLIEDAHFWVEVRTSNGNRMSADGRSLPGVWAAIEPTPGYQMLHAPETMLAWLRRGSLAYLTAVVAQPVASSVVVLAITLVFAMRRRLLDGLLIGWWSIRSRTVEAGRLARLTLRLLEWRAWAYRRGRPTGATLGRWEALRSQADFVALAGWALYAPSAVAPLSRQSARAVCGRAIRTRLAPSGRQRPWRGRPTNTETAAGHP